MKDKKGKIVLKKLFISSILFLAFFLSACNNAGEILGYEVSFSLKPGFAEKYTITALKTQEDLSPQEDETPYRALNKNGKPKMNGSDFFVFELQELENDSLEGEDLEKVPSVIIIPSDGYESLELFSTKELYEDEGIYRFIVKNVKKNISINLQDVLCKTIEFKFIDDESGNPIEDSYAAISIKNKKEDEDSERLGANDLKNKFNARLKNGVVVSTGNEGLYFSISTTPSESQYKFKEVRIDDEYSGKYIIKEDEENQEGYDKSYTIENTTDNIVVNIVYERK